VSNLLGHSSLAITLSVYGHFMPGREDEAVEAIGGASRNVEPPDVQ